MHRSSGGRRCGAIAGAVLISVILAAVQAVLSPDAAAQGATATPALDNGAVVVMYHRFGDSEHKSTNIRLDQFEAHIAELTSGGYTVLPVPEIVAALRENRPLPDRTVGITIDDAYRSVFAEAWPRLKAAGLPFTLFVSTQALDSNLPDYMSWDQLREMVAGGGVTVGNHGVTHGHMVRQSIETVGLEISEAAKRFEQ
jgi:peptidoglycan/xylan/chitin deacetylase (PgdA/CDA1 family)